MPIRIDNSTAARSPEATAVAAAGLAISDRAWGDVDKAALARRLQESGSEAAIREAYLYVPNLENQREWGGPHHDRQGGRGLTLVPLHHLPLFPQGGAQLLWRQVARRAPPFHRHRCCRPRRLTHGEALRHHPE